MEFCRPPNDGYRMAIDGFQRVDLPHPRRYSAVRGSEEYGVTG
jgi:hypothetical protein